MVGVREVRGGGFPGEQAQQQQQRCRNWENHFSWVGLHLHGLFVVPKTKKSYIRPNTYDLQITTEYKADSTLGSGN